MTQTNTHEAPTHTKCPAKDALDAMMQNSCVHWQKPIQIAEILFHHRTENGWNLNDLESYKTISKHWRDNISTQLVERRSTTSQKHQDSIFSTGILPTKLLAQLGAINKKHKGLGEAYIYKTLEARLSSLHTIYKHIGSSKTGLFSLNHFVSLFRTTSGLRQHTDNIYEILVYALLATVARGLQAQATGKNKSKAISKTFDRFIKIVLGIHEEQTNSVLSNALHQIGIDNATGKHADVWNNFWPSFHVKHLELTTNPTKNNNDDFIADNFVVIVCLETEKEIFASLLRQIGWQKRMHGIITIEDLDDWYNFCLNEKYRISLGSDLFKNVRREFNNEFPSSAAMNPFMNKRGYDRISMPSGWEIPS